MQELFLGVEVLHLGKQVKVGGWRVARIFTAFSKAKEASRSSADAALKSQVLDLEPILITINCQFAESGGCPECLCVCFLVLADQTKLLQKSLQSEPGDWQH